MPLRLAINGFGRIGRAAFRVSLQHPELAVAAINDLADPETLAHLLKYDSVYGRFPGEVGHDERHLIVNGQPYAVSAERDPRKLPWQEHRVDVVLECTGRFVENGAAKAHLEAGAKRVVVSAPTKGGETRTFILGVNDRAYRGEAVVSNASCTTNCVSPVVAVVEAAFGIVKAAVTTVHSYTAEQNLVDAPPPPLHKDLRRSRAAAMNIVPTTTGATVATTEVIPGLEGVFDGLAVRVPTPVGSLSDFTFVVKQQTTVEAVNEAFRKAAGQENFQGILSVTEEPLVSSDIIGDAHSAIVDLSLTDVIDGDLVKVVAWYDNEWGYSNRLVELAALVGKTL